MKLPPEFLRDCNVTLAGVGGTGSQVLTGLARLHLALLALGHPCGLRVTAFDPEPVRRANVGRQLFSPSDVGRNKAAVLIHRLNSYFGLDWVARPEVYRFGHQDILITCVDSAAARRKIYRAGGRQLKFWLDTGNTSTVGQVILGQFPGAEPHLRNICDLHPALLDPRRPEDLTPSCSLAESLQSQSLFINQHVATWALQLLWHWFRHGVLAHQGYFINLDLGTVRPIPCQMVRARSTRKVAVKNPT